MGDKVESATAELEALAGAGAGRGRGRGGRDRGTRIGSSHELLVAYDRLLEGLDRILQYHFEFLNLGYGAYFVFYELCRQAFPDISDQTIAKMVSGIDVLVCARTRS